ncbi:MAG: PEP-CTERM sorting domain-containing protein [Proteobacteria bacterium]|uniref:PEP-CTERM sorting domain-containing protein n=1 Tax=Aquabacterium sp. TaxID=1872578 RepID=UPI0035C6C313|nr:PEP-CTERM sorting domain-containing protein [Pseudomonadota bacterium]
MSILRSSFVAAAVALSAAAAQAATVIPVAQDGSWNAFTVDALSTSAANALNWIDTDYSPAAGDADTLSFSFTVADKAILRVVDLFAAGDVFNVSITSAAGTQLLGTSAVTARDLGDAVLPFAGTVAEAWGNVDFSQLEVVLGAGTYTVTGSLLQSVTDGGFALNSTAGSLSVTAVPEPTSLALVLAAVGVVGLVSRRRAQV